MRILRLSLSLHPTNLDVDTACVGALFGPTLERHYNGILLDVPADYHNAHEHRLVRGVQAACHSIDGFQFIFLRHLWWNTPPFNSGFAHLDPAYYAYALLRTRLEAEALGATSWGLELEPYLDSLQHPLKKDGVPDAMWKPMVDAVKATVAECGLAPWLQPCSANVATSPYWIWRKLGINGIAKGRTAYTRLGEEPGKCVPPEGMQWADRIDGWTTTVGPPGAITIAEGREFTVEELQKIRPEVQWHITRVDDQRYFPALLAE